MISTRGSLRTAAGPRLIMAKPATGATGRRKRVRICIHRQYTIDEAARAIGTCRATIKRMIKRGMPAIADRRPILILGEDLANSYRAKRRRQPCAIDECFCFKCRRPRKAVPGLVDFVAESTTGGNLVAICEACGTVMNKRVGMAQLNSLRAILEVSIRQAEPHLSDSPTACLNDPLQKEPA